MTDDQMEQLLQEIAPVIRGFARSYFKDGEQVEDALQEHTLYLWAHRGEVELDRNPRSYAISAAHNVFWGIIRRRRLESTAQEFGLEVDAPYTARSDENEQLRGLEVRRALAGLPVRERRIAWMVFGQGYTTGEVAVKAKVSRQMIDKWLRKARTLLCRSLDGWR